MINLVSPDEVCGVYAGVHESSHTVWYYTGLEGRVAIKFYDVFDRLPYDAYCYLLSWYVGGKVNNRVDDEIGIVYLHNSLEYGRLLLHIYSNVYKSIASWSQKLIKLKDYSIKYGNMNLVYARRDG